MTKSSEQPARTLTALDVQLAAVYFPILVELARDKRTIGPGELIDRAKAAHPNRKSVQNVLPVGIARRLDIVRAFCAEAGLPDLASLATSDAADGTSSATDLIEARRQVFSFDWSSVEADFAAFLRRAEASQAPKAKLNEKQAIQIMWEHYKANQATIPKTVSHARPQIITDILAGLSVEDAFAKAVALPPPVVKRAKK